MTTPSQRDRSAGPRSWRDWRRPSGALPQGYDTPCTPDIFSQGQWQLLSIARAVAADPKLLLLDEITANLDAETERAVLRALKRATADRTVLSISHRVGADTGRLIPIGEES